MRTSRMHLDDVLRGLPERVTVYVLDGAWLAVDPSGLFVLTEDSGDLAAATLKAAEVADDVRRGLADQLVWVPFVDALCATTASTFDPDQPCLVVPLDLIAHTISSGPVGLDDETLGKLRLLGHPVLDRG